MKEFTDEKEKEMLTKVCKRVKKHIEMGDYEVCNAIIVEAMKLYPHAAQPHNLMGILMERNGENTKAMKHYRAAHSLDQTFIPSRLNMERLGSFKNHGPCIFDEEDCQKEDMKDRYKIEFDEKGIGHLVKGERL